MPFSPYLNFRGNCREAFEAYRDLLGGELSIMSMADAPSDYEVPEDQRDLVMHAYLVTAQGDELMASDAPPDESGPVQGMYVHFSLPDAAEAERVFNGLSDGGQVEMPLSPTFWAEAFGVCVDRFGTPWMISGPSTESDGPVD